MKIFSASLVLFLPLFAFASIQEDYLAIKDNGRNLQDTGAICEEVAQLDMQRKYPANQYTVLTGITYSDNDGTLGELDVIVFEREGGKAILVGEVKCWKDVAAGLAKAYDQRARFVKNLRSSKQLQFKWLTNPQIKITKDQFIKLNTFVTIAQKGSGGAGFEFELAYSLNELMELRHAIIRCQSAGQCRRPTTPTKDF